MKSKNYQRRHLRAPLRGSVLYADGDYVLKGTTLNISMGGLLIDQLPNFPESDDVSILLSLPHFPLLKNFSLLKMQTFSSDLFARKVIRAKAKMVRREQLSQNLDNIFRSRFGLEFIRIAGIDEQHIEEYVTNYASNLVYLQTLIDSFNSDDETKKRARALAHILGYKNVDRIVDLHAAVSQDYKSLQWS